MKVTDLEYALENKLIRKYDLIIKRVTKKKQDAVMIIEGAEGEGKTNTSLASAYYFRYKTGRPISLFFRLPKLLKFASETQEQIIIWDEPALDSLSVDWYNEVNKSLIRLLMTCRKKRHIFLFNFTKFYKFSQYIVVDRSICLIHMYSRKEIEAGRFIYIRKKKLETLWNTYKKKNDRDYKGCMAFGGSFPLVEMYMDKMNINIEGQPNVTLADYEALKDKAILTITADKKEEKEKAQREAIIQKLKDKGMSYTEIGDVVGVTKARICQLLGNSSSLSVKDMII